MNTEISNDQFFDILWGRTTPSQIEREREERRRRKQLHKEAGQKQNEYEAIFCKKTTRELLGLLKSYRSRGWAEEYYHAEPYWWALKKVLATRPHIPKGTEAKRNRQQLAKRSRGQGKSRDR